MVNPKPVKHLKIKIVTGLATIFWIVIDAHLWYARLFYYGRYF
jgi:hypothetical protein